MISQIAKRLSHTAIATAQTSLPHRYRLNESLSWRKKSDEKRFVLNDEGLATSQTVGLLRYTFPFARREAPCIEQWRDSNGEAVTDEAA